MQESTETETHPQKQQSQYQRLKLLGSGSFGKAYLVKEVNTNLLYVIKQIDISQLTEAQQENARRQAKILEMLDHPNIIRFKEIYTTEKMRLNIVMEYANAGDLSHKIAQAKIYNKLLEEAQILNLFTQICLGIKHLHDRKIIHRDLKAQNIFLCEGGCVKIGDMGVARVLEHTVAKAKTVVGTPYYLSPQIIQNKPYSFKSDIWSLGALLYEMCALSPPFTANNLQFLALKIVRGSYSNLPPQYSPDLRALIKSMLNTNANLRPSINQILSSPIINRKIKSLLTESQNVKQFSHTVLHKFNVMKNQVQDKLRPPPNLMEIQQENQNLSAIEMEKKMYELQLEAKAKTPYSYGKNAPPVKKKVITKQSKPRPSTAENLAQIMKIKATPLQHHAIPSKLPKVSPNPIKKRPQSPKQVPQYDSQKLMNRKNVTGSVWNKKKSIDCANFVKQPKSQEKVQEKYEESMKQVENLSANYVNKRNSEPVNNIKLELNNQKQSKVKPVKPASNIKTKPNPAKAKPKQKQPQKQKKDNKFELVSEQMKNKQKTSKQLSKKNPKKGVLRKPKPQKKSQHKKAQQISIAINTTAQQQTTQEQKCNETSDDKYDTEQFEVYEADSGKSDSDLSYQLSNSDLPELAANNRDKDGDRQEGYMKMLAQLEIINKLVDEANGKVQNLPILGSSIPQLLQLSDSIRKDETDLQSQQSSKTLSQQLNPCPSSQLNLAYFNSQSELQNLRMALEQIFGIDNLIAAYKYLEAVILKNGLDFNEEDVIRNLLKECPQIQECLLRRHFRLIVTVIVLENQIGTEGASQ